MNKRTHKYFSSKKSISAIADMICDLQINPLISSKLHNQTIFGLNKDIELFSKGLQVYAYRRIASFHENTKNSLV